MLIVLLLAALPWMIAVPLSRNSRTGAVIGLVALLPAIVFVLLRVHRRRLDPSSFCLGG